MIELLAPAGNWAMLRAAVKAGANSVYFGIKSFNMRAAATNFSPKEVKKVVEYCHQNKIKAYCTINIIIFEKELKKVKKLLILLKKAEVDAVICWDLAVVKICRELGLTIHLSTQASVANSESAKLWKEWGVERIILARECSLEDIKSIKEKTKLEVEIFVHGARCISLSGRCFLSYELFNKSANRGECLQPCRREYKVIDEEGKELVMENNFIMSAKDLCSLPLLKEIINSGADCLKIEGRNRGAQYVFYVVSAYREAIKALSQHKFDSDKIKQLTEKLNQVYNKDFSRGYLVNYPYHQRCNVYGSKASQEKVLVGKVNNFYKKIGVVEFKVESGKLSSGDKLAFEGPTTGYIEQIIEEIHTDNGKTKKAQKGEIISLKTREIIRKNDLVYLIKKRKK